MLFVDNIRIFDTFKPITVERLIVHARGLKLKVIMLSNVEVLSIHDDGYSRKVWCALIFLSTVLLEICW